MGVRWLDVRTQQLVAVKMVRGGLRRVVSCRAACRTTSS